MLHDDMLRKTMLSIEDNTCLAYKATDNKNYVELSMRLLYVIRDCGKLLDMLLSLELVR